MKTKLSKKVVSLVMAISMLLTLTTMVNVFAADDGILADLDMNDVTVDNYADYDIEPWGGNTISVSERATEDKYITVVPNGGGNGDVYIAFMFDEELNSDMLTIDFEVKGASNYVHGNTALWLTEGNFQSRVDIASIALSKTTWEKYQAEVNLKTGEVILYKSGVLQSKNVYEGLKNGFNPKYVGFSKYIYTDSLNIDNLYVHEGLNGIYADYDMSSQSDILAGGGATITVADGVLTGKAGYTIIPFNRSLVSGKYTVDFELKVPNGNNGVSLSLMDNTSGTNTVDVKSWSWSGEAPNFDWTKFSMEIDVEGKTVKFYKAGTLNATIENVENLGAMKYVRFVRWSEAIMLKSFSAKKTPVKQVSAGFTDVKNISIVFDGTVSSNGIMVTDSNGTLVSCTASVNDTSLNITANSYFKAGETYIVSGIKDIYGNVLESVILKQDTGIFADYTLDAQEEGVGYLAWAQGGYEGGFENGALWIKNSQAKMAFTKELSGKVVVTFDMLVNSAANAVTAGLDTNGDTAADITLADVSGTVNSGKWVSHKIVIDIDAKTATFDNNAAVSIDGEDPIKAVCFTRWGSEKVFFDNFKATREKNAVSWTKAYGEENGQWKDDLTAYVPTFVYVPFKKAVAGVLVPDGYTAELLDEAKNCIIRCTEGHFPAGTTALTLTYWDEYGFTYTENITVNAADMYAKVKGISVNGTTATASFSLLKNKELPTVEYIIASYDEDDIMVNAKVETRTYDAVADDELTVNLDVSGGYKNIRAFMWDGELKPLSDLTK